MPSFFFESTTISYDIGPAILSCKKLTAFRQGTSSLKYLTVFESTFTKVIP